MEKQLQDVVSEAMSKSGTKGVLCADVQGLSLISTGSLEPPAAATISQISTIAAAMDPSAKLEAVTLHYNKSTIIIHQQDLLTVGVHTTTQL